MTTATIVETEQAGPNGDTRASQTAPRRKPFQFFLNLFKRNKNNSNANSTAAHTASSSSGADNSNSPLRRVSRGLSNVRFSMRKTWKDTRQRNYRVPGKVEFERTLCPELWLTVVKNSLMPSKLITNCVVFNRKSFKIHANAPDGFTPSIEQNKFVAGILDENENTNGGLETLFQFVLSQYKVTMTRKGGELYAEMIEPEKPSTVATADDAANREETVPVYKTRALFLLTTQTVFMGTFMDSPSANDAIDLLKEMRKLIIEAAV